MDTKSQNPAITQDDWENLKKIINDNNIDYNNIISNFNNIILNMRVGILGGSFNPPTIGHQLMAVEVLNLNLVDEVWMVPCGYREDKKYPVSDE